MFRKKTTPVPPQTVLLPIILASMLAQCGVACAAEPTPLPQYAIEQPSQPLAASLQAIAHETSTSVLFDPKLVRGRVAHPVSGRLSAFEAITAALQGTGLVAERMKDGAIVVRATAAPAGAPAASTSGAALATPAVDAVPQALAEGEDGQTPTPAPHREDTAVVKVEITGSRLKRIDVEGPAPVNVYTAQGHRAERAAEPGAVPGRASTRCRRRRAKAASARRRARHRATARAAIWEAPWC